jgi:hypothetical protein
MSQAERATEQLYENTDVREDLTDDEAQVLLKWGEARIAKLAEQGMDDTQFDEAFDNLLKIMSRINRLVGRRDFSTPEEQQEWMDKIAESAGAMGVNISTEQDTFQQQSALDNIGAISALTALIDNAPTGEDAPSTPSNSQPGEVDDQEEIEQ